MLLNYFPLTYLPGAITFAIAVAAGGCGYAPRWRGHLRRQPRLPSPGRSPQRPQRRTAPQAAQGPVGRVAARGAREGCDAMRMLMLSATLHCIIATPPHNCGDASAGGPFSISRVRFGSDR